MLRTRALLAAVISLGIIAILPGASRAGTLTAYASCVDGSHIAFSWSFYEDPQYPTGHPEWVGYDVLRRPVVPCGAFVRINAVPLARILGESQDLTYTDAPPIAGKTYEYQVVLVDANRQVINSAQVGCYCFARNGWASCPDYSAPLTEGTLEDWGWALFVHPCPGSCYDSFFFSGPMVDALRPYAGTGVALRFYGSGNCGTIEGCEMNLVSYDFMACGPTPVGRSTWGRVKAIYR